MGTGTDVQPGEEITASKINLKLEDVDEQDLNATVVATAKIQDGAVTSTKVASDAITSTEVATGAIGQAELATGAARWDEVKGTVLTNVAVAGGGTVEAIDTGLGSGPSQYSAIPQANFNYWEDSRPGGGTIHVATDAAAPGGSLVVQAIQ